jgi:hypothetical protein
MNQFEATLVMIGLFALRCVVPLALTAAVGYLMNRLVDRWAVEETAPEIRPEPARIPTVEAPAQPRRQPVLSLLSLPCWVTNSCPEEKRKQCPACERDDVPCWQARLQAEGTLPANCPDCPRYIAGNAALA